MKKPLLSIVSAVALTAIMSGTAYAEVNKVEVLRKVLSAVGAGSNVHTIVRGSTVTIIGFFEDSADKYGAIRAAKSVEGVERVLNHASERH